MAVRTGIIIFSLLLGALALPTQEYEMWRMYGGSVASEGSHPHMVAITLGDTVGAFICGGSLITPRSVLTAGHCVMAVFISGSLSRSTRVTVGTNEWNNGGQTYDVTGNVIHPNFEEEILQNDLGILYTTVPITYSRRVQAIALSFDFVGAGVAARVAGWGWTTSTPAISARLLELQVNTIDGQQCVQEGKIHSSNMNNFFRPILPNIQICTHHPKGAGFGTCHGDSGSALLRIDTRSQIGIVSWGFPCARGAPDMFTRISAYQAWLNQNIRI